MATKNTVKPDYSAIDAAEEDALRYGEEFLGWNVLEYPKYQRGRAWYTIAGALALGLLIYSVVSANFLFALFIVMFSIALYMTTAYEPRTLRFAITETGIRLGDTRRDFREISRFWVVYQPGEVQALYIDFKSAWRPRMVVSLAGMNPNEVRGVLSQFVREDLNEDDEPFTDYLARQFKI